MAKFTSNSSVTIDGLVVNTFSTLAGIAAATDASGALSATAMNATLEFSVDIHDQSAVPFTTVRALYDLCHSPGEDKIKPIKVQFWTDENRQSSILSLSFRGRVTSWMISSGGGTNHVLSFALQPEVDTAGSIAMQIGS